jgi:hypothetical protein
MKIIIKTGRLQAKAPRSGALPFDAKYRKKPQICLENPHIALNVELLCRGLFSVLKDLPDKRKMGGFKKPDFGKTSLDEPVSKLEVLKQLRI